MNMVVEDFEEDGKSLQDYVAIVKRRWHSILIPAAILFTVCVIVAFILPATYQSQATILIEEQEVPRDLVPTTITSYAAQQVQVIGQRIMTVENVTQIAEKHELYRQDDGGKLPSTELVKIFKENMSMELISAEVIDPKSGRPTEATIAFTLSFKDENPVKAQKVTNELVTYYLNENLKNRTDQAQSTAAFLAAEATSLNEELIQIEELLAKFKKLNESSLPQYQQYNLTVLDRTERELSDLVLRRSELKKILIELEAERAQIDPSALPVFKNGSAAVSDADRLKYLRSEYRNKSAQYKMNHPEMIRLKRELDELQSILGVGPDSTQLRDELTQKKNQLTELRLRYTPDNPQVKRLQREVGLLEKEYLLALSNKSDDSLISVNPAYVYVDTKIRSTEAEIITLDKKYDDLKAKIERYDALVLEGPRVEKEFQALTRNYNSTQLKYQEIKAKQRQADLAENLEQERKGERFTLVEPPILPLEPVSPNRKAIVLLGFLLAAAIGFGCALMFEAMDSSIRGEKQLVAGSSAPVLGVIPYLKTAQDFQKSRNRRIIFVSGVVTLTVLGLLGVHLFIKPLDVLWFVILGRFGMG